MNSAHIHLVLNHLPVVGSFFALFLLMMGAIRRNAELQRAALAAFVIIAVLAIPTFLTGEPAEDVVEHLGGVSKGVIHNHEEAAEISIWVLGVVGVFAFAGLLLYRRAVSLPKWFTGVALALALAAGVLMAWTANLGGQIRHPEIVSGAPAMQEEEREDHHGRGN